MTVIAVDVQGKICHRTTLDKLLPNALVLQILNKIPVFNIQSVVHVRHKPFDDLIKTSLKDTYSFLKKE